MIKNGEANADLKIRIRFERSNLKCDSSVIDKNNNLNSLPNETFNQHQVQPNLISPSSGNSNAKIITNGELNSSKKCAKPDNISISNEPNKPCSSSLVHYYDDQFYPKNDSKLLNQATATSASTFSSAHRFKKKKKKKKSKHKTSENVERKFGGAKKIRLLFGNDSISIEYN